MTQNLYFWPLFFMAEQTLKGHLFYLASQLSSPDLICSGGSPEMLFLVTQQEPHFHPQHMYVLQLII